MAYFLILVFIFSSITCGLHHRQVGKLAIWLFHHKKHLWTKHGCPGTHFFKGEPNNGLITRFSALRSLYQTIKTPDFRKRLRAPEAREFFRKFDLYGRLSTCSLIIFVITVFILTATS